MNKFAMVSMAYLSIVTALPAYGQSIQVTPNASTPTNIGVPENFTGNATFAPLVPANDQTGASTALVTFLPGARTVWHTHPAGQTLIVQTGKGWIQTEGEPRQDINPGDVVWIPAGVKHWHGASATVGMTHISVTYTKDGKNVDWLEPVTDPQYVKG
ncbi:cupin domain-containing protein [Rhizobium sp. Leaf386]|uniref:(R)-mandelonitrile lyase n=1 Tax=Rhizobium sp. Leaf386 TaxID=1736359 RepID=UPI000714F867|nr:cupin domain-containing protein [Rhizobium sp. Leaf386]KQT02785.1 hypothetical protein ASG50_18755 [Rhizobium sp. Leaf386]